MFQSRIFLVVLMVLAAAISRILPHPPNFTPILAVSLFSGAFLSNRKLAFVVPIAAMFLSDLILGFHDLMVVVYLFMVFAVIFGRKLNSSPLRIGGVTFLGSFAFFLITNLAVWWTSGMYTLNFEGLVSCFVMALPFFQNSVLGDVFYSTVLFGSMFLLDKTFYSKSLVPAPINEK